MSRPRSLRRLILTGLLVLQVAVLTGVIGSVYAWARAEAHDALHEQLRVRARTLTAAIEMDRDGLEVEASPKSVPEYHDAASGVYAVVYDSAGESVIHSGSLGELEIPPTGPGEANSWEDGAFRFRDGRAGPDDLPCAIATLSFELHVEDEPLEPGEPLEWTPPSEAERRYQLVVAVDNRGREAALARLRLVLGLIGAAALITTALGGLCVARYVLQPVNRMTAEAGELTPEDTSRRLRPERVVRELGSLSDTLNSALDRLGRALDLQRRFTSDASHELRTPLAVLRGNVDLLLRRSRSTAEYRKGLERQRRIVGQMTCITENLLALARADDDRAQVRREPVELPRIAHDVCDDFSPLAEEADVRLTCTAGKSADLVIDGDDVYLGELVQNLVSNAVKFTPPGGRVDVRLSRVNGHAVLDVEDTGPGIPIAEREHVFERFYRVGNGTHPRSGAGLGLAIADWIVREHGGSIEIQDREGGGTVLRVRLPVAAVRVDAEPVSAA